MPLLFAQLCFLRPYRNYFESRLFYGAADFFVFDGAVVGDYRGFGFEAYLCGGSVDFVYRFGDAADAVVAVHTGDFYRFSAEDGAVEPGGLIRPEPPPPQHEPSPLKCFIAPRTAKNISTATSASITASTIQRISFFAFRPIFSAVCR